MTTLTPEQEIKVARLYLSGFSAQQIADELSVSLKIIFGSLKRQEISRRTSRESNHIRYEAKPLSYHIKHELNLEKENLKLSAVMLYWAEGYKVGEHGIDFANSDPEMAFLFRRFLTEICGIDERRLRCFVYCYEGQDIEKLINFWSELLEVPKTQFTKPYIKKAASGVQGPRMIYGLVHLRYSDRKLLRQVLLWIDEYKQKICVGGGVVNRIGL